MMDRNAYTIDFDAIGRSWTIQRADMEALWEKMATESLSDTDTSKGNSVLHSLQQWEDDERLPYYAELWPSSFAMAKWLMTQKESIQGKQCIDLGCGLGFTSLCGAFLGARVLGVDYEEEALVMARMNARINAIPSGAWQSFVQGPPQSTQSFVQGPPQSTQFSAQTSSQLPTQSTLQISLEQSAINESCKQGGCVEFSCMDWRKPSIPKHSADIVYASDIVYEKQFVYPILDYLDYVMKEDGKAWIAEPGRSIFEYFHNAILGSSFRCRKVFSEVTSALSVNIPSAPVCIWEVDRAKR